MPKRESTEASNKRKLKVVTKVDKIKIKAKFSGVIGPNSEQSNSRLEHFTKIFSLKNLKMSEIFIMVSENSFGDCSEVH